MKPLHKNPLFFPSADKTFRKNTSIGKAYGKVKEKFKDYARGRDIEPDQLRLLDVCDDRGGVHPKLLRFIESLPQGERQSEQAYNDYKSQTRSIVSRIIKSLTGVKTPRRRTPSSSLLVASTPEYLKPVLPLIPRMKGTFVNNGPGYQEKRLAACFSDMGAAILSAMIKTSELYKVDSIESLLVDHYPDMRRILYGSARPAERISLDGNLSVVVQRMRAQFDLPLLNKRKKSLYLEDLPAGLRSEIETFIQRSPLGIETFPELIDRAAGYRGRLGPFEENTTRKYVESFLLGVACILREGDVAAESLRVKDFFELEEALMEEGGRVRRKLRNRLIDVYREQQQNVVTKRKRKGCDSANFAHFLLAIKAIAAFNGIFDLQSDLNQAYTLHLDTLSKQRVKAGRKKAWPLDVLDDMLNDMRPTYNRILKEGSYKFEKGTSVSLAVRANINFCLFYLAITMMRYLGYRQMQLRDCVFGDNIKIGKDGTLTLHWSEDEVKNDRALNHPLNKQRHGEAYGVVIEAITLYAKTLYRFAASNYGDEIRGQFFLKLDRRGGFRAYESQYAGSEFRFWFQTYAAKYLKNLDEMYPHFLRGLCGDWHGKRLKVGAERTSNVLGDTIRTVDRHYLDRNAAYDGEDTFDAAEEAVKARRRKEAGVVGEDAFEKLKRHYEKRERRQEKVMKSVLKQLELATEQNKKLIALLAERNIPVPQTP
jgi:hypothetical protein